MAAKAALSYRDGQKAARDSRVLSAQASGSATLHTDGYASLNAATGQGIRSFNGSVTALTKLDAVRQRDASGPRCAGPC